MQKYRSFYEEFTTDENRNKKITLDKLSEREIMEDDLKSDEENYDIDI